MILERDLADRLIKACDQHAYHELVAYAEGITIGELRDFLERGAVVGEKERDPQKRELRRFCREYCRTDAAFGQRVFKELRGEVESKDVVNVTRGGNIVRDRPQSHRDQSNHWAWFERRWPCGTPLAIGNLLSGERVEQLALDESLANPNAEIQAALTRARLFRAEDLEDPPEWLRAALDAAGYTRDAEPDEGPPDES